jgi:hypothetical protein
MIERGNFEPLSPKKNLILKTLKALILTLRGQFYGAVSGG